jgi:hypothetical protein
MGSNAVLKSLLRHVPAQEREAALRAAVDTLTVDDTSDIALAVALLSQSSDKTSAEAVLARLQRMLDDGDVDHVISATLTNPDLQTQLLRYAVSQIHQHAYRLQQAPGKAVCVSLRQEVLLQDPGIARDEGGHEHVNADLVSLLRFIKATSGGKGRQLDSMMAQPVITLLGCADHILAAAARDELHALIMSNGTFSEGDYSVLWAVLRRLLSSEIDFYHDLAFSLWLRCAAQAHVPLQTWVGTQYWQLIQTGLREGDGERQKQCLAILRRSVYLASQDPTVRAEICSTDHMDLGECRQY